MQNVIDAGGEARLLRFQGPKNHNESKTPRLVGKQCSTVKNCYEKVHKSHWINMSSKIELQLNFAHNFTEQKRYKRECFILSKCKKITCKFERKSLLGKKICALPNIRQIIT